MSKIIYENCDCMVGMARYPDKHFDLAIVDPPYGIGEYGERSSRPRRDRWTNPIPKVYSGNTKWDKKPESPKYFKELSRISKNQIIWGANYFIENIPNANSSCWVFWDKRNAGSDFADGELAWTSFGTAVRKFEFLWSGFRRQQPERRIHPTQKPVALYKWLLTNYAKPGDLILDTHVGSASSLIACHDLGFDAVGFELDPDYYKASKERLQNIQKQITITDWLGDSI